MRPGIEERRVAHDSADPLGRADDVDREPGGAQHAQHPAIENGNDLRQPGCLTNLANAEKQFVQDRL